ncbi:MAG: GyrI-like domain-containing protein [Propionibacteriaceae bacterium]|nr:GyrI-like domain-containing protein [Propionibacteriaceae bacterium]
MNITDPEIIEFAGSPTVVVRRENIPVEELAEFMDTSFTALGTAIREHRFVPSGPGFSRYDTRLLENVTVEVGFPVEEVWGEFAKIGDVTIQGSELPAGTTAVAKYKGGFDEIADAWQDMLQRLADRGYETSRPFWEYYDVPPAPGREERHYLTRLAAPVERA